MRIQDNRFKETLMVSLFSSVALGLIFNNTSDNQATHCILNLESPVGLLPFLNTSIREHDNQILFNAFSFLDFWCEAFSRWRDILVPQADQAEVENPQTTGIVMHHGMNMIWRG